MPNEVQYVTVHTLTELKTAIKPYTLTGRENARQILLEGLTNIKTQIERHEEASAEIEAHKDEFGGYMPAAMQHPADGYHYVDDIIKKKLGGKRVGFKVRWAISDGVFEWDAFEDKLIKCSGT